MTAEFFVLAFSAAINPSLLGVDLVLIVNQRPRAMLTFVLLGGMSVAIAVGLIDVLVIRANVVKSQGGLSAGVDLAFGVVLLVAGCLLLRSHRRRDPAVKSSSGQGGSSQATWVQRALREPRLGLAVVVGGVLGLPGVLYLTALHGVITRKSSVATAVIAVIVFAVIEFTLLIVPLVTLALRPAQTEALLRRSQAWLINRGRQVLAWVAFVLSAYFIINAAVSLASSSG